MRAQHLSINFIPLFLTSSFASIALVALTKSADLCLCVALRKEANSLGRTDKSEETGNGKEDNTSNRASRGRLRASREKRVSVPAAYIPSCSCFVDEGLAREGLVQMTPSQVGRWAVRKES